LVWSCTYLSTDTIAHRRIQIDKRTRLALYNDPAVRDALRVVDWSPARALVTLAFSLYEAAWVEARNKYTGDQSSATLDSYLP
jgi:hypothetical protein